MAYTRPVFQVRVHQKSPLVHAVDTGPLARHTTLTVVGDPKHELVVTRVQVQPHLGRVGVAGGAVG